MPNSNVDVGAALSPLLSKAGLWLPSLVGAAAVSTMRICSLLRWKVNRSNRSVSQAVVNTR